MGLVIQLSWRLCGVRVNLGKMIVVVAHTGPKAYPVQTTVTFLECAKGTFTRTVMEALFRPHQINVGNRLA